MNYGYDENGNPVVYASQINQNNMGYNNGVKRTNSLCVVGFVLSFLTDIVGLVISIVGLVQAKKNNESGSGLAIAGIVISSIKLALVIGLLIFIFYIIYVDTYSSEYEYDSLCSRATCDYFCEDGEYCRCYYIDKSGYRETTYCYVDWNINEKDYENLA